MEERIIRAGIIGYNEGNGHPYSFASIINGYDKNQNWERYPQILNYLKLNQKEEENIPGISVTKVYAPNKSIAKEIAKCAMIPTVVEEINELLYDIDIVMLLTDETKDHWEISKIFLEKNIPVFIDKPLCGTLSNLNSFIPYLKKNILFSCSGFLYHDNILSIKADAEKQVSYSIGKTKIDWLKYGIHLLEPIYQIHKSRIKHIRNLKNEKDVDIVFVEFENNTYSIIIRDNSNQIFSIDVHFQNSDYERIVFNDNYTYFKRLIEDIMKFQKGDRILEWTHTANVIRSLIEAKQL